LIGVPSCVSIKPRAFYLGSVEHHGGHVMQFGQTIIRISMGAALALFTALPILADETEGHVLAYDREAGIIILTDKTVWEVPGDIALPENLGMGDRVLFEYETAGEDGMTRINGVTRLATALPEGTDGGS